MNPTYKELVEALREAHHRLEECLYCAELAIGHVRDAYGPDSDAVEGVEGVIENASAGSDKVKDVFINLFLSLTPDPRNPVIKGDLADVYDALDSEVWQEVQASAIAIFKDKNKHLEGPGENSRYSWKKGRPVNVD